MSATLERNLYCGSNCQQTAAAAACGGAEKCGLCPLAALYAYVARALPAVVEVTASEIPEPYRQLLVHDRDMTSILESFHRGRTHLRVLGQRDSQDAYQREVVLAMDGSNQPVEFGAITIQLALLPLAVQTAIRHADRPLGGLLHESRIEFVSHPKSYIRVQPDPLISQALQVKSASVLYGRCNALLNHKGAVLADIVEILPP